MILFLSFELNFIFIKKGGLDGYFKFKAPGLILSGLVDEVEVHRSFGGCLPVESTTVNHIFKTLRQLNAQRDGNVKNSWLSSQITKTEIRGAS